MGVVRYPILPPGGGGGGGGLDAEQVRDVVAGTLVAGPNLSIEVDDTDNTITIAGDASRYNVVDFGAVGDGDLHPLSERYGSLAEAQAVYPHATALSDQIDWAAAQAALKAARMVGTRRGGIVYVPSDRRLRTNRPLLYTVGVSILGDGWSQDTTFYNVSGIIATPDFVGSAVLLLDADGNTVSDPVERPDRSWHWGTIERLLIEGNGKTGPHGIDPGWNGEASSIRNVSILNANSGIYLTGTQASCNLEAISVFDCEIGLNCDDIAGTVRAFGLSGDNNNRILRVKGGRSANVSIYSLKTEFYTAGTGDPAILVEDLRGGALSIFGGWADTNAARDAVIQIAQPSGSGQRPRITLAGFDHNDLWANLIDDTFDGVVVAKHYGTLGYPLVTYNVDHGVLGAGSFGIGYGRSITGTQFGGEETMPLVSSGPDNGVVVHAGTGSSGGRLMDTSYTHTLVQWRKNGQNNLGFYGAEPVTRQAVGAAATDAASTQALVNDLRAKLIALGLIS